MNWRLQILQADDRPRQPVSLPEWGIDALYVATLSAADRDDYEHWLDQDRANYQAKLVCRALVDEHGQRVFTDDDATALGHKSAAVVARVFNVAVKINGLLKSDVEELAKNSGGAASDVSAVGSHCNGAVPTPTNC